MHIPCNVPQPMSFQEPLTHMFRQSSPGPAAALSGCAPACVVKIGEWVQHGCMCACMRVGVCFEAAHNDWGLLVLNANRLRPGLVIMT